MVMPLRPDESGSQTLEAERQVLGTCILRPEHLRDIDLTTTDFVSEKHRVIWRELQYLAAEGQSIDTLHLRARLEQIGKLAFVGDDYLLEIEDTIPAHPPVDILKRAARQRALRALANRLALAADAGDDDAAARALRAARETLEARAQPLVEWRSTVELFAPLPPIAWRVRALQICPGRPCIFGGYGSSAKTISAQALALAVAAGTPAFDHFETALGEVRHLDYEQGWFATARRYQRLALGHRIDRDMLAGRLHLAVFPRVYLDDPNAYDAYAKLAQGVDLIVLDALRGAAPTQDENDSAIRRCIDLLTRVSEVTGCAFVMLHHARKRSKDQSGDARESLRGSGAIYDSAGAVYELSASDDPHAPRRVKQTKAAAEGEGISLAPFLLDVADVPGPTSPKAGLRVSHRLEPQADSPMVAKASAYEAQLHELVLLVERFPGKPRAALIGMAGLSNRRGTDMLDELERRGALRHELGPREAKHMFPGFKHGSNRPSSEDM